LTPREATDDEDPRIDEVSGLLREQISDKGSVRELAIQLLRGADEGGEVGDDYDGWKERFGYQFLWLNRDDYSKALVRALWLAPVFAATDFGRSRQRDMGQVWTDTARGFLGEIALSRLLKEKFSIETKLDTRRGELEEFLPTDIAQIRKPGGDWRRPKLLASIKTTKFNGRWLDLPGAQFEHSDVYVLVKIGILRQHFLAFLKAMSFLRDKLFVSAKALGELTDSDATRLWNEIPEFEPMPAYVAGFLYKDKIKLPISSIEARTVGRNTPNRIEISRGVGLFSEETVRNHPKISALDPTGKLPIVINPIIEALRGAHFLAHSGGLEYGESSWERLAKSL
jgi:hypothetical protein